MDYEIIENLVEKLSCDFVLADPSEPESLSGLLPILKQIHGNCMKLSLKDKAKEVLNAREIITAVLKEDSTDIDKEMADLGELISELSSSVYNFEESEQPTDMTSDNHDPDLDPAQIEENLDRFGNLIRGFCPGEIPDLGAMLNTLDELIDASKRKEFIAFHEVCRACKGYVENMALKNIDDTKPIEEGLVLLRSLLNHLKINEPFAFVYSDVLELLNIKWGEEQKSKEIESKSKEPKEEELKIASSKEPLRISDDDMEILVDFVSEAQENLDTIEINLIDLEQDPSNNDIINDIFRPFHTIKGVSGFLALTKINKLSHTTENLLDSARSGDFLINDIATDAILASVDILKNLIARVSQGFDTGFMLPDDDIDIDALRDRLKKLQVSLTKGEKELLGEILVKKGDISSEALDHALEIQKDQPGKKIGEILVQEKKAAPKQVASALMDQNLPRKRAAAQVKVSTQKLDDLVDYAGELVIAQSMLRQKTSDNPSIIASVSGKLMVNLLPAPFEESIFNCPLNFSIPFLTTSIPTPLPETSVTSFAVENPGWSIRS